MTRTSDPSGRRRFLGLSAGAATAVLAGWRPAPSSALGANDRIRVGVIGTGGRARGLMRQLKELPGQQIVDSGKLGQVTFVDTYWYQMAGTGPMPEVDTARLDWKRWLGPARDQPFDTERFLRWRHFKDFGGGVLTDLLTHWIDVVHWYMGVDTPLTAVATGRNYRIKSWEWPDAVTATFEYPRDFMVTTVGTSGSTLD